MAQPQSKPPNLPTILHTAAAVAVMGVGAAALYRLLAGLWGRRRPALESAKDTAVKPLDPKPVESTATLEPPRTDVVTGVPEPVGAHSMTSGELEVVQRILERSYSKTFAEDVTPREALLVRHVLDHVLSAAPHEGLDPRYFASLKTKMSVTEPVGYEDIEDAPLRMTRMLSESPEGYDVHSTTIFSAEEEDEYSEESAIMCVVDAPDALPLSEDDGEDQQQSATSQTRCLIVAYGTYIGREDMDARTIEAEGAHLAALLRMRGYRVETIMAHTATRESVLRYVAAFTPDVVFGITPLHADHLLAPPQHTLICCDLNSVSYSDLHNINPNVCLVLDTQSSLETIWQGHVTMLSLTTGAYLIAGSSQWLYDGHFTPHILSLLSTDTHGSISIAKMIAHCVHAFLPDTRPGGDRRGAPCALWGDDASSTDVLLP
eukprot:PhM_4_TR17506/c0_g1_i2/m.986